jgi:Tfp pilus assembly protein PilP
MNRRYQRDVNNLSEYYTELTNEMKKVLKRPGLSAELMAERQEKNDLIPDEMTKKKEDLLKKYSIRVNLRLRGCLKTPSKAR